MIFTQKQQKGKRENKRFMKKSMALTCQKLSVVVALVLVLVLGFATFFPDASKLITNKAEKHGQFLGGGATFGHMLSTRSPIPPSGPSKGHNKNPPPLSFQPRRSKFGVFPKGPPIQPSDAGKGHGLSPPFPRKLEFSMLPKGTLIPPSGPGGRHNASPPQQSSSEN